MVLSSSNRTSSLASIANQNQGGGSKKAGFAYQTGRTMWSNVALGTISLGQQGRKCCSRANLALTFTNASISRPTGRNNNISYWHIRGT